MAPNSLLEQVEPAGWSWTTREALITVPRRRDDVVMEELDGEAILSDPTDGAAHRLNQTALAVWAKLDGSTTTRQIAENLTQTYEVEFEDALDHVEELLVLFAELKLLESPCH